MITDHDHVPVKTGRWYGPWCAVCGKRGTQHLSFGVLVANAVGGDPLDYVDKD